MAAPDRRAALLVCVLVVGAAGGARAQSYYVGTLTGIGSCGSADGPAASARLCNPASIATTADGGFFVRDAAGIRQVSPAYNVTTIFPIAEGIGWPAWDRVAAGGSFLYATAQRDRISDPNTGVLYRLSRSSSGTWQYTKISEAFGYPIAIATTSAGTVYVADAKHHVIWRVIADTVVGTLAGALDTCGSSDGTGTGAQFCGPSAIAVDANGTLYVADGNGTTGAAARIRVVTPEGVVTTRAELSSPWSAAIDITVQTSWENTGIAVDANGVVYVTSSGLAYINHASGELQPKDQTIIRVTADGTCTRIAGYPGETGYADGHGEAARFSKPSGIAVDAQGRLLVADNQNHAIRAISTTGEVSTILGVAPFGSIAAIARSGGTYEYTGLAFDASGNLLVADSCFGGGCVPLQRVLKRTADGRAQTFAGAAGQPGTTDGTGSAARFYYPEGLATDPSGKTYVIDYGGCMLRMLSANGTLSSASGNLCTGGYDGALHVAATANAAYVVEHHPGSTEVPAGVHVRSATSAGPGSLPLATVPGGARPGGISVGPAGDVWFAVDNALYSGTSGAPVLGSPGTPGDVDGAAGTARFNKPEGLAFDAAGNLYVADSGNCSLRRVSAYQVTTVARFSSCSGTTPRFVTVGSDGSIYVSGTGLYKVDGTRFISINLFADTVPHDGNASDARLVRPRGIALEGGTLYVTEQSTATIRAITTLGTVTTFAGAPYDTGTTDGYVTTARFSLPAGIAGDGAGGLYVADGNAIRYVTTAGQVTTVAGSTTEAGSTDGPPLAARFFSPNGLAVGPDGSVYIADYQNHTIRKLTRDASPAVTTVAGTTGTTGSSDGWVAQHEALFSGPTAVAVSSTGAILVADGGNYTIRKIENGLVSTLAGQAGTRGTSDGTGTGATFSDPASLAFDQSGSLYVGDGAAIRKVTPDGVVTTVAGKGVPFNNYFYYGYADGIGSAARMNGLTGIATASSGTLYLADNFNHVVRIASPTVAPSIATQPASASVVVGRTASFTVGATGTPRPTIQWQSSTDGATWTSLSDASPYGGTTTSALTVQSSAGLNGLRFRAVATSAAGQAVSAVAVLGVLPPFTVTPSTLGFGAIKAGADGELTQQTDAQTITVTFVAGTGSWTATANQQWVQIGTASASGSGQFTVTIANPDNVIGARTSLAATITVTSSAAPTLPASIPVSLTVDQNGRGSAPYGIFDTPSDGATGVTGSIAVTGWALDDIEVAGVRIYRDPVGTETMGQLVYIGNATLVEGARPDLISAYPSSPRNTRGGWGYLLLTNFLPGLGDGTYKLYAYADDVHGNSTLIGTKTITCANSTSFTPFGAIDTPAQGQTVSGTVDDFGWVLSPGSRLAYPPHGTVSVLVDGASIGSPGGWTNRSDLSALFPVAAYSGIDHALGVLQFDSRTLSDGVHTIAWIVTDDAGGSAGVGSRYFTVLNGAAFRLKPKAATVRGFRLKAEAPIQAGDSAQAEEDTLASDGVVTVNAREMQRIEVHMRGVIEGHQVTSAGPLALPPGSRLDPESGTFVWMPGPGFVGPYDFLFTGPGVERRVHVILRPEY